MPLRSINRPLTLSISRLLHLLVTGVEEGSDDWSRPSTRAEDLEMRLDA
jgi:hypothetical protein